MSDVTDDESSALADRECIPCKGGVPPLEGAELEGMLRRARAANGPSSTGTTWRRPTASTNFRQALAFTNRVGELAEEQGHHPDIHLSWGKVRLEIWTHKIDGLHDSDFILAAKADRLA